MGDTMDQYMYKQDLSEKTVVEESAFMTIEFLRARLQAERSVSKTARERADQFAKRVVELEEQLRTVTLQRKKAEKATSEVLAILENNGICDISEVYESRSNQEGVLNESKEGTNEVNSLTISRPMTNKMDDMSCVQLGSSQSSGTSSSCSSCTDGLISFGKKNCIDQGCREDSSASIGSSKKQCSVKSHCQITQGETRSEEAELRDQSLLIGAQENRETSGSEMVFSCSRGTPEILKGGCKYEKGKLSKAPREESLDGLFVNGCDRNFMAQALEHQAQIIGQYEEEENAQKEWEEKFRDNRSCTEDSSELGNRSDVTEERDEIRGQVAETVATIPSHIKGGKFRVEKVCSSADAMMKSLPNKFLPPHLDRQCSQKQQCNSSIVNETGSPEFSFPNQENLEVKSNESHRHRLSQNSSYGSSKREGGQKFSSIQVHDHFHIGESSRDKLQVARHHETTNALNGVLESLQSAKLSLKHKLNRLPGLSQGTSSVRAIEASVPATNTGDSMEIPVGCADLFRLPTRLQFEPTATNPYLFGPYANSGSSLTRYNPNVEVGVGNRYSNLGLTRYNTSVAVGLGDRYTKGPNLDIRSGISSVDPYMDTGAGLPDSSRYVYPSYPDLRPRRLTDDRFLRRYPSNGLERPAGVPYSVYDQISSNMQARQ